VALALENYLFHAGLLRVEPQRPYNGELGR